MINNYDAENRVREKKEKRLKFIQTNFTPSSLTKLNQIKSIENSCIEISPSDCHRFSRVLKIMCLKAYANHVCDISQISRILNTRAIVVLYICSTAANIDFTYFIFFSNTDRYFQVVSYSAIGVGEKTSDALFFAHENNRLIPNSHPYNLHTCRRVWHQMLCRA